jgi:hypothetical protein
VVVGGAEAEEPRRAPRPNDEREVDERGVDESVAPGEGARRARAMRI